MTSLDDVAQYLSEPTRRWLDGGDHLDWDGKRVFYRRVGVDGGPKVLLIHGFPTSSHDWRHVIGRVADAFDCVAHDQIGYGLSDKPRVFSYSLFQQADLVEELAGRLGFDRVHLVSHDVGTSVHTELLARQQEGRLGFEVLSSTFLNGSIIKRMAQLTATQQLLQDPARLDEAQAFCETFLDRYVAGIKRLMGRPESVTEDDAVVLRELMAYQDGHLRMPNVYAYVRERYLMADRWLEALARQEAPTQFVWGTDDPIATIAMGRHLHELFPSAGYRELAGVGHFTPVEAPTEVAGAIRTIVTESSRS